MFVAKCLWQNSLQQKKYLLQLDIISEKSDSHLPCLISRPVDFDFEVDSTM